MTSDDVTTTHHTELHVHEALACTCVYVCVNKLFYMYVCVCVISSFFLSCATYIVYYASDCSCIVLPIQFTNVYACIVLILHARVAMMCVLYLLLHPGWSRSWQIADVMRVAMSKSVRCCFR